MSRPPAPPTDGVPRGTSDRPRRPRRPRLTAKRRRGLRLIAEQIRSAHILDGRASGHTLFAVWRTAEVHAVKAALEWCAGLPEEKKS